MSRTSILKSLKSFRIEDCIDDQARSRMMRLTPLWEQVCAKVGPDVLKVCSDIYYKTLDGYLSTRRPITIAVIGRTLGRHWNTVCKRNAIEHVSLDDLVHALALSKTIPITTGRTKHGGTSIMPTIVIRTIFARARRGEPVCDSVEFQAGECDGPELSPAGLAEAHAPFEDQPAVQPDELSVSEQKFDGSASSERIE